jgi:hypothetical protein
MQIARPENNPNLYETKSDSTESGTTGDLAYSNMLDVEDAFTKIVKAIRKTEDREYKNQQGGFASRQQVRNQVLQQYNSLSDEQKSRFLAGVSIDELVAENQ